MVSDIEAAYAAKRLRTNFYPGAERQRIADLRAVAEWALQQHAELGVRCPVMLPNQHGGEQCGGEIGHDGECCYASGD